MGIYIQIPDGDKERLSPILTLFLDQLIYVISDHELQTLFSLKDREDAKFFS